jgi:hypothetical protein
VGDKRFADRRAVATDQVEDPRREPDLVDDVGEDERVQRSDLRRLDHDGAARREGRRYLGRDLTERIVPWRDRPDHAHRFAQDQRVVRALLEPVRRGQLGVDPEVLDRDLLLCALSLGHADLQRDQLGEPGGPLFEGIGDRGEVPRALGRRGLGPAREGLSRCRHRRDDVGGRTARHVAHGSCGRRVDDRNRAWRTGGDPPAVDVDRLVHGVGPGVPRDLHGGHLVDNLSIRQ